jgi:hypothetical protein
MSGRFRPHLDVLPPAQRGLWPSLTAVSELGFVLYGGTAIALRLGHRQSVDFDLFNDAPLDRDTLRRALPALAKSTVVQDQPDTLTALFATQGVTGQLVKISFFGGIDIGRVGEPEQPDGGGVMVASLADLMATKLKVMLQRVEVRDYRDVVALLRAGVDLAHGLASARILFGPSFQPSESLKALTYFEGGDVATLDASERRVLVDGVRAVSALPGVKIRSRRLQ